MKYLLITTLMVLMSTGAKAQKELFDKYEDNKGVSTVVISKALLNLAGGFSSISDKKLSKMAGKMDNVRILNCHDKGLIAKIKREAQTIYTRDEYEEMMRINEEGQRVVIYQRVLKSGKNEFALFNVGDSDLSIINITGILTLEDMKQFTVD